MLQEKAGLKKLDNVRKDHSRRLQELERVQVCIYNYIKCCYGNNNIRVKTVVKLN